MRIFITFHKTMFMPLTIILSLFLFACNGLVNTDDGINSVPSFEKVQKMDKFQLSQHIIAGVIDESGYKDGFGLEARFNTPHSFSSDARGNLYVADTGNNVIRKISPTGQVSTWAGSSKGFQNGDRLNDAKFDKPKSIVIVNDVMYIADSDNHCIRKIVGDTVSTLLGSTAGNEDNLQGGSGVKFKHPFKFQVKYFNNNNMFLTKEAHDTGHKHLGKEHLERFNKYGNEHDSHHKKYADHIDISLRDGQKANRWRVITLKDGIVKEVRTIRKDLHQPVLVGKNPYVMMTKAAIYMLLPQKHVIVKFDFNKKNNKKF